MKKTRKAAQRNIIGRKVREARRQLKPPVNQEDLARRLEKLGVEMDRSAISRIESQTRYVMDFEAAAIARALRVSVGWLFGERV
jgi:transcriptional regulator with XRE-family HTH domain